MKKILIALASVALFAGCSADGEIQGTITVNEIGGTKDPSKVTFSNADDYDNLTPTSPPVQSPSSGSNNNTSSGSNNNTSSGSNNNTSSGSNNTVSSSSGNNSNNLIYCSSQGFCAQVTGDVCDDAYGYPVSSCPPNQSTTAQYCLYDYYGSFTCDLVPGMWTHSVAECYNDRDGDMVSGVECIHRGAPIYNE